jgi:hypothetical protein
MRYLELDAERQPRDDSVDLGAYQAATATCTPSPCAASTLQGCTEHRGSGLQITLQEEDKIGAYYGGGYLYAVAERTEPLL